MPKIRIKQLHERVATDGLHMGQAEGDMFRRKLEPGEVVDVPETVMIESNRLDEPMPLFDMLYDTGLVDVLPDREPVTRPLDYLNHREGTVCSPTFKALSPTDQADREQALARVATRLAKLEAVEEDEPPAEEPARPVASRGRGRRGRRTANHGEAHTT